MSFTATMLKVVFPQTSSIASKTFSLDKSMNVGKAVAQILEQVGGAKAVGIDGQAALFIAQTGIFLDEAKTLADYAETLKNVNFLKQLTYELKETVELRSKPRSTSSGVPNFTLIGLGLVVIGSAVAIGFYLSRKK